MTDHQTSELDRLAGRVAALTEQLMHLPAVATLDWTDRAARSLCRLAPGATVCVIVGRLDEHGGLVAMESSGAAGDGIAEDSPALDDLRSRLHRLSSLGVGVDLNLLQARPLVGWLEQLNPGRDWRTGPLSKVIHALPGSGLMLAVGALGSAESGRVLAVLVGPVTSSRDAAIAKLRAVMPVLQRRALAAIGSSPTTTDDWLTEKERAVLDRLILGESVRQIAETLNRSPHTVHDHVKNLHRKLQASSRGELVARALGHSRTPPRLDPATDATAAPADVTITEPKPARPAEPIRERATPAVRLVEG